MQVGFYFAVSFFELWYWYGTKWWKLCKQLDRSSVARFHAPENVVRLGFSADEELAAPKAGRSSNCFISYVSETQKVRIQIWKNKQVALYNSDAYKAKRERMTDNVAVFFRVAVMNIQKKKKMFLLEQTCGLSAFLLRILHAILLYTRGLQTRGARLWFLCWVRQ